MNEYKHTRYSPVPCGFECLLHLYHIVVFEQYHVFVLDFGHFHSIVYRFRQRQWYPLSWGQPQKTPDKHHILNCKEPLLHTQKMLLNCGMIHSSVVVLDQNRQPLITLGLLIDPPLAIKVLVVRPLLTLFVCTGSVHDPWLAGRNKYHNQVGWKLTDHVQWVHQWGTYSDSKNCPNVWHFLIVCDIASHADQTEPKC